MSHELYDLVYNRDLGIRFPLAFFSCFFAVPLQAYEGSPAIHDRNEKAYQNAFDYGIKSM